MVLVRHDKGFLKELRLIKDPEYALKIKNKMLELYLEDSVDMREQDVE